MPKKSQPALPKALTPRQRSRWQKERQRQRHVFFIGSLIIVLIIGTLGYGIFNSRLAPLWRPAVQVNDAVFNQKYFVKYLQAVLGTQQKKDAEMVTRLAPLVAEEIQNNELIKKAATEAGISVTDEEINQQIREMLVSPDEKEKVEEAEIQRRYGLYLDRLKLSDDFWRELMAATILRKKWGERLESQVPAQQEQIKLQSILLDTEEVAKDVQAKLQSGGDFAALAKEFSKDEATKDKGGELGWVSRGIYPDLDEAAFGLSPGTPSQPISTSRGHYILLVAERQDSRLVDEDTLKTLKSRALDNWLKQARKENRLENYLVNQSDGLLYPEIFSWIMGQIK